MGNMADFQDTPTLNALLQRALREIRREPGKAMIGAFGAGLLCSVVPMRPLVRRVVRLAFSSVGPALAFLGMRKARELCMTGCAQDTQRKGTIL